MGPYLSIDETSLSDDELYTIVTNKEAKGRKGSIVAIVRGTKAEDVIEVLLRIKKGLRHKVKEVTLDMAANMSVVNCVVNLTLVSMITSGIVQEGNKPVGKAPACYKVRMGV